jgi:eukaryotic-like serine/threonine-protein kinase
MVVNITKTDPNAKDPLIGQQVGASYVITEPIGSGGMGTVYAAESAALGGLKIAVKVLTTKSSEAIARFRTEAFAAGKVNDQFSVVGLIDTGVLQTGQHYIALQYCDGGSLEALLRARTKPLPFDDILSFISPICAALVRAHAAGLVHRDLKPANILFVKDGEVFRARLADFGIVKLREHARLLLTAPKTIMGTPGYMSPEQWMDTGQVDSRSDIYSIGCVLYELVTGRLPYTGTTNEVMHQAKHNAPIMPPSVLRSDTPQVWNSTIMRCLSHRREDRIQTTLEVIHTLADAIENGRAKMGFFAPSLVTHVATGPTAATISQAAGGPAVTLWSEAHSQRKSPAQLPSQRRPWAVLVAGIVVGAVTTGAVALMTRGAGAGPDASHITVDEHEAAPTAPAPTGPDAPHIAPREQAAHTASAATVPGHAAVASTIASEPAVPRTVARVGAAPDVATLHVTTPDIAASETRTGSEATSVTRSAGAAAATRNASEDAAKKPAPSTKPRPITPPPSATPPIPPEPPPNRAPTSNSSSDATSEAWLSIRVKGGFAQVSIDGDKPSMSPKRKRVQVGLHRVVMTGYPAGSETEQRREFDVNVPAGKDETIIYKTW